MKYNTIIIKNSIDVAIKILEEEYLNLSESGNFFCIVKSQYRDGYIDKDFFDLIEYATEKLNLYYINTIVIPEDTDKLDNILYCVWFVKDKKEFHFNKDEIREKPIWKDVEWGKRKKNYNPKGKDPGNVWIPTKDDGKANITEHLLLSTFNVFDRILDATISDNGKYLIIVDSDKLRNYKYNKFGEIRYIPFKRDDIFLGNYIYVGRKGKEETKVIFNTSENMVGIENKSIDLIVTSPPYWDLKNYYKKNQIGQESYDIYSSRMNTVWSECYDKLNDKGSLWININIRIRNGKPILLPKLFIDQCKKIGFIYRGILIWHKSSGIPTNSKNLSDHHEYVLIFTKSNDTKINIKKLFEFKDYKNDTISGKLFWNINRKAGSVGKNTIHPAIFPTELINRIVNVSTLECDFVLDPFLGSGTSLIAAVNNKRNFIGYEFNEGFKNLMDERFNRELINDEIEVKFIF
ncbi:DNA-methyltransferase [Peptostreptococcus sp. D1]|uniref:DNA-methyltransferase n=1 Tax=Peptostreptococcus sp. D1 TaxID=72304 RepID=UPI0015A577F1|nr:site-specific DNA-methyltransferase [Peptostreptococcus sp. D1]